MVKETLKSAAEALRNAKRLAILTGAGISAESGVPTFRANDGLWEGHRIEDVATPQAFERNPLLVWQFYNARRANLRTVTPNPGHYALVSLEKRFGDGFTLATQNVDGLHRTAGSRRLIELHGNLQRTRCLQCGVIEDRSLDELGPAPQCPKCEGQLRPDIVWFNEMLPTEAIETALESADVCDCLLVIGTSAVVFPAAEMVPRATMHGATVIEINLNKTDASRYANIGLYGNAGQILPQLLTQIENHP
jgi:NAD-dependent deacetylase